MGTPKTATAVIRTARWKTSGAALVGMLQTQTRALVVVTVSDKQVKLATREVQMGAVMRVESSQVGRVLVATNPPKIHVIQCVVMADELDEKYVTMATP